uniref:Uncharacterized protein n=1 Tax=Anguilla anguilla TaxID=7936 RepID=A0A0E9VV75_ANGAN
MILLCCLPPLAVSGDTLISARLFNSTLMYCAGNSRDCYKTNGYFEVSNLILSVRAA